MKTKPFLPEHMATNTGAEVQKTELEREGGPSREADSVLQHADYFYPETWLPLHREDGTLPPHFGERMVLKHPCSPYPITLSDLIRLFGGDSHRQSLLQGLLDFRRDLRALGVKDGFHWLGGSFIEKSDHVPSDIDVVSFFVTPQAWGTEQAREALYEKHPDLFVKERTKARYHLDAYLIQLAMKRDMFRYLALWNSLFGHDRHTLKWKGFVEIDMHTTDDDQAAGSLLRALAAANPIS